MRVSKQIIAYQQSFHHRAARGAFISRILGIETSCDDTGVAVIDGTNRKILAECLMKQDEHHKKVKGINPMVAVALHKENIDRAVQQVMESASLSFDQLTAVAVTRGPGIGMCLDVGLDKAKMLAKTHELPLIAVNHMEGHALMARMLEDDVQFPFLALLISGGHTLLIVCKGVGQYIELGGSMDDAVGEAYDKTARLFGLEWNGGGGKSMERIARDGVPNQFKLPVPLVHHKNCSFSFSGLKAAVTREFRKLEQESHPEPVPYQRVADLAWQFQSTIVKHLLDRLKRAVAWCKKNVPELGTIVISGGVASNEELRTNFKAFASQQGLRVVFPPPSHCTDNGVMIAWAGMENWWTNRMIFRGDEVDNIFFEPIWPLDPSCVNYFPEVEDQARKRAQRYIDDCQQSIADGKYDRILFIRATHASIELKDFDGALQICDAALGYDPTEVRIQKYKMKLVAKIQSRSIE